MDDLQLMPDDPLDQINWEAFLDGLPELEVDDLFHRQQKEEQPPLSAAALGDDDDDGSSPNPILSEIENLLMADADADDGGVAESPSSDSDYDKLLAEILVEPDGDAEDSSSPSDKGKVHHATPEDAADDPMSKKQKRQIRNRDAAVRSRERKKLYVKNLEMKSRYFEGECRRLEHLLQCCYAENHALRLCLQSRSAFGASMTKLESAVLLLESLLLVSLLWFMGIICQLSLPLKLWVTEVLPRENTEQTGLRVALKGAENRIDEYSAVQSFVKSRRCRASRKKMKLNFLIFYHF